MARKGRGNKLLFILETLWTNEMVKQQTLISPQEGITVQLKLHQYITRGPVVL